jgi:hypothetical protein
MVNGNADAGFQLDLPGKSCNQFIHEALDALPANGFG